jgi:hypothetical protein
MATYNMGQWKQNPQRKARKVFKAISRVLDFNIDPITDAAGTTTTWAVGDIVQLIGIRAGTTVLGVDLEIMKRCLPAGARVQVGYGSDADRWGTWKIDGTTLGQLDPESDNKQAGIDNSFSPLNFSSTDTIDITLFNKIMTAGRLKVTVYVLEDARLN